MNDQELSTQLSRAKICLDRSYDADDIKKADSYALTSIAASLFIIAERSINEPRNKEGQPKENDPS